MKRSWSLDDIRQGFQRFESENSRLPTAPEIDKLAYLPSSRKIQREFGGLQLVRKRLGYEDVHFGKGLHRSAIANRINKRGRDTELKFEKILKERFGEVFVHTERIFDDSKNRVDFYVYAPGGNFGVDIFYTETMRDLQKNINIKIDKYKNFNEPLYLVVGNEEFEQYEIDRSVASKRKLLNQQAKVVSMETILSLLSEKSAYDNPLGSSHTQ